MTNQLPSSRSVLLRWTAILTGVILAVSLGSTPAQAAITDPPTVVSLTFDDGNADNEAAVSILDQSGMKGTFYITTGWIDSPTYFTRAQLASLKAEGHEIGGHSVSHPDLITLPADELNKQICQSRNTLADWGFPTTSFAFPYASVDPAVEAAVQACGFNSARNLGDIASRFCPTDCDTTGETMPPLDPFQTRALDQVDSTWTITDLQNAVLAAEAAGGGWVQYTFHHVCSYACDPLNLTITPELLQEFVSWLALRTPTSAGSTTNTVVKTVGEVVGGAVKPLVASTNSFRPAPAPGENGVLNPSLETAGGAGLTPQCWQAGGFGVSTSTFTTVAAAHTGVVAEQLDVTAMTSGSDAKLALTQDLGTCAPTAIPGHSYSLRAWYTSTIFTQFDVYYRNAVGGWIYWTSSPYFAATSTYAEAIWQTAPLPAGVTGISFGLNLLGVGTLVTDDYALYDTVGAPGILVPATPTITGTAKLGDTLTAVPGTWGPETATLSYQWLSGGVDIAGATSATYVATAADVGKALTVRVTGSAPGYFPASASATSLETALVLAGDLVTAVPTITGTPVVAQVLTADPGVWGPATAVFAYQWLSDGIDIPGATSASYPVAAADSGKPVSVRVTGSEPGYTPASTTSASLLIGTGALVSATPTITGTPRVGDVLTAVPGTWGPADAVLAYQWLAGGADIVGATSATYSPVAADVGAALSVRVTGSAVGYEPASVTVTSAETVLVALADIVPAIPTITGTPTVGSVLTAVPGTWTPVDATLAYQWFSGGVAVEGATSPTYTVLVADSGLLISVRVTGTAAGYSSASATSASVTALAGVLVSAVPTITGTGVVGSVLTAVPGTWSPAGVTLSYQWLSNGAVIASATAATYTVVAADSGKSLSVRVTGTLAGYATASATSAPRLIGAGALVSAKPTITGTATIGSVLTAVPGAWSPSNVTLAYQWLRAGLVITGATSATYTLVAADLKKAISVRVTGSLPGFTAVTVASAAVTPTAGILVSPIPTISGVAKVGSVLTAVPGAWSPATATLVYQWLRNGSVIAGATAVTYTPVTADTAKALSVRVNGSAAGYTPASAVRTSAPTALVLKAAVVVTRIDGADRYATAVKISQSYAPGVARVYVAGGVDLTDALSAGPAAKRYGAPLLLTTPNALPAAVKAEIARLRPAKIVVVGGVSAVSAAVATQLAAIAPVVRLSGADRYASSRAIARDAFLGIGAKNVYLVSGASIPDSLSAAPAAALLNGPTILIPGTAAVPDAATLQLLRDLRVKTVTIVGSRTEVSSGIELVLKLTLGSSAVKRVSGADQYTTAAAINLDAFSTSDTVYLAVGSGYSDALLASALAGSKKAPLYLTQSNCLVKGAVDAIQRLGATKVVLVGTPADLSDNVFKLTPCA